ncbi:hypothetical protein BASA50_005696 [Batrachochytrium salamandrivorans]|uniref:Extracellular metalloproteinase n=1 Tax=Batrachochytrium salamandrivorans TaxID=1357716 RepID=A0ABQ8FCJ1_9FUNG|nr:hypothetical protein BASA50_005696 [Batrachochytrium salamandrivorans]KAH9264542.1 hypothetical protein BASA83_011943 [Batrachochytrium salamandrivorans]
MFGVPLILVWALVSSTVVAQPKTKGFTSLGTCLKRLTTSKASTKTVYEWIQPGEETSTSTSDEDPVEIGLSYITQKLDIQPDRLKVMTSFIDYSGTAHVYGVPLYLGFPIGNLHAAVHVTNGQVFFYSAIIIDNKGLKKRSLPISESTVEKSSEEAVKAAVNCLKVPFYSDVAPVKESYSMDNVNIFVWKFQLRDEPITRWFEVRVDLSTGDIVSMDDFKRDFTYTAIELPNKSPYNGFSEIVDPENLQSSLYGWSNGDKTVGNNVLAKVKRGRSFKTTTLGVFSGGFDPMLPPQTLKNTEMGVINAFYVANTFHDVFYAYGFNEPAGNFQQNNFKRGGKEGDPIIINIQDSKKKNGAYFYTPPDGQSGVLDLHIFTNTEPNRDSALDNTVMIHELAHGLSTRLTGGAHENMCMMKTESLGLSEGYSDIIAIIFTAKPEDTRDTKKVIGGYVQGDPEGMRDYPYTTDMDVNPLTYQDVAGEEDKHILGTIWGSLLWEVYWNLVDEYGFSANLHDATQNEGNIIFLQILVGTLMIQPCNPTFASARDAMLATDYAYYGGINKKLITKGFAKRGLGSIS